MLQFRWFPFFLRRAAIGSYPGVSAAVAAAWNRNVPLWAPHNIHSTPSTPSTPTPSTPSTQLVPRGFPRIGIGARLIFFHESIKEVIVGEWLGLDHVLYDTPIHQDLSYGNRLLSALDVQILLQDQPVNQVAPNEALLVFAQPPSPVFDPYTCFVVEESELKFFAYFCSLT